MNRSIKILMLVSSLRRSGPIIVVQNILRNLDPELVEVEIVKLMDDEPERSITSEFVRDGFIIHELHSSKLYSELFPRNLANKIERIIEDMSPDIIHVHGYQSNRVANFIRCQIPLVETVHCILPEDYSHYGKFLGKYMMYRHRKGLSKISAIAAISESVRTYCVDNINNKNIRTIYNGVNYPIRISRSEARKELDLGDDLIIFTVVGSLIHLKDPITVIKSFKNAFPKTKTNVRVIFLGKGELMDQCKEIAKDDDRIQFLGWKPNVYTFLSASNYTICASHSEGFGLNFVESLVNGVPVIGSSIPAFEEFYKRYPELEKLSFPIKDVEKLATRLKQAAAQNWNMINIQKDAISVFGAKTMADNYTKLYLEVISKELP